MAVSPAISAAHTIIAEGLVPAALMLVRIAVRVFAAPSKIIGAETTETRNATTANTAPVLK